MKKILMFMLLGMFLLVITPNINAEIRTLQYNNDYDFKIICSNNGSFCSSSSFCNITLMYPDSNLLRNNNQTTNQITFHNVTVFANEVNQLGFGKGFVSCTDGAFSGRDVFDYVITADGKPFDKFPQQFFIIILGFLLIFSSFFFERLRIFKYLGSIMIMILGIITLFPGYSFINWTTLFGKTLGFSLIGLGFYFLIEDSFGRGKQEGSFEQEDEDD